MRFLLTTSLYTAFLIFGGLYSQDALAATQVAAAQQVDASEKSIAPVADADKRPNNELIAATIERNLVQFDFHWGRILAHRGAQDLDLGFWGQKAPSVLSASARGEAEARKFYHYHLSGMLLKYAGLAVILADLGYAIAQDSKNADTSDREVAAVYGILGGGIVMSIVGGFLDNAAHTALGRAAQAENEAVIHRALGIEPKLSLYVAPVRGGAGGGAMLRW